LGAWPIATNAAATSSVSRSLEWTSCARARALSVAPLVQIAPT
jgi:hypothetical protein